MWSHPFLAATVTKLVSAACLVSLQRKLPVEQESSYFDARQNRSSFFSSWYPAEETGKQYHRGSYRPVVHAYPLTVGVCGVSQGGFDLDTLGPPVHDAG